MSEEPRNELTPGEHELGQDVRTREALMRYCYQKWIEHYYPAGQVPAKPQPYRDALRVLIASRQELEDVPEETQEAALNFKYALDQLEEAFALFRAEVAITRGAEAVNEAMRRHREIKGEDPEAN
jgi:hypothetical protein